MHIIAFIIALFLALPAYAAAPENIAHEEIVPVDTSVERIRALAAQGNPSAENALGVLYSDGQRGVEKNPGAAFEWYLKSAQHGYNKGQLNLATVYARGSGTAQNDEEAYFWYLVAANAGNKIAVIMADAAGKKLAPEKAAAVQKRAAAWPLEASQPPDK